VNCHGTGVRFPPPPPPPALRGFSRPKTPSGPPPRGRFPSPTRPQPLTSPPASSPRPPRGTPQSVGRPMYGPISAGNLSESPIGRGLAKFVPPPQPLACQWLMGLPSWQTSVPLWRSNHNSSAPSSSPYLLARRSVASPGVRNGPLFPRLRGLQVAPGVGGLAKPGARQHPRVTNKQSYVVCPKARPVWGTAGSPGGITVAQAQGSAAAVPRPVGGTE